MRITVTDDLGNIMHLWYLADEEITDADVQAAMSVLPLYSGREEYVDLNKVYQDKGSAI